MGCQVKACNYLIFYVFFVGRFGIHHFLWHWNKDVFDTVDGALLANINVALYQRDAQDEKAEETTVSSLKSVKVSPDLSTAVIINSSHYAIAVDLNLYFRYVCHKITKWILIGWLN